MIKGQNFIGGGGRLHDAADYTGAERERESLLPFTESAAGTGPRGH
jgi:hypothetical protein